MLLDISRTVKLSIVAGWCAALTVALWLESGVASPVAMLGTAVIGLAPAVVVFTLARRPSPTTSEAIRAVCTSRGE